MRKFSLQRVLDLKERREQAVAVRLAAARAGAESARLRQAEIEALRTVAEGERSGGRGGIPTVGELQNMSFVIERLEQRIAEARDAVRMADARVDVCMRDLTTASQERRMLDRLKTRKEETELAEEAQQMRKTMDDIALSRFARAGTSAEGAVS